MNKHITEAIKVLNEGGIVIFPTDTAFGIGCRIDDEDALKKLFSVRRRPVTKPVPVLFESITQVKEYMIHIPVSVEEKLMQKYWPGALTIALYANLSKVPSQVRGGGLCFGTRIPAHETPLSLIRGVGVPIVGTSANFSGDPTPYKLTDLNPALQNLVDYVIPGTTSLGKESTVIDCTVEPWVIERQGAIKIVERE